MGRITNSPLDAAISSDGRIKITKLFNIVGNTIIVLDDIGGVSVVSATALHDSSCIQPVFYAENTHESELKAHLKFISTYDLIQRRAGGSKRFKVALKYFTQI